MTARAVPLPRPDLPDYAAFQQDLIAEYGLAATTADTYGRVVRLCVDWLTRNRPGRPLLEVTPEDLRSYLRHLLAEGRSTGRRQVAVYAMRRFYGWLGRDDAEAVNPALRVRVPASEQPTTDFYTSDHFARMLQAALAVADGHRLAGRERRWLRARFDHCLLATFRYTGIRLDELTNLRLEDVDLQARRLRVERGKGGRERYLPIAVPLARILETYLGEVRPLCPESVWLFANPDGLAGTGVYGRVAKRAVFDVVVRYAERAGLPGKHHPHRLRHGVATELVRHKADPTTVQKMLGHADLSTTSRYLHLDDNHLREVVDQIYPEGHADPSGADATTS